MSYPSKPRDKTSNWRACNQSLKQRVSLKVWFDPNRRSLQVKRGRQQGYSDQPFQICLSLKVLLGLPLRQTTGFMESPLSLSLSGLSWSVLDFSTLSRRQNILNAAIPYCAKEGLHLLIGNTGIKEESGSAVSTVAPSAVSGARSISLLMSKRWRPEPSRSPPVHR